jgi:hypothetical protein
MRTHEMNRKRRPALRRGWPGWNAMSSVWRTAVLTAVLCALTGMARAESVPFTCEMQDDHQTIRIVISNPAKHERSCIANCQFQTPLYGGEVQVICAHPVAAEATNAELCTKDSGGLHLIKQTFGAADCSSF